MLLLSLVDLKKRVLLRKSHSR